MVKILPTITSLDHFHAHCIIMVLIFIHSPYLTNFYFSTQEKKKFAFEISYIPFPNKIPMVINRGLAYTYKLRQEKSNFMKTRC